MRQIVEFNTRIERLRERAMAAGLLALQRARAAGDSKESISALEWVVGGIEILIDATVRGSTQPNPEPEKTEEPETTDA